jgi:hypothetical protein
MISHMLKSKDVVRRIIEDQSGFLVSFPTHDGYFHVDDQNLRYQIRNAHREGREIAFTFDPTLKILSLT